MHSKKRRKNCRAYRIRESFCTAAVHGDTSFHQRSQMKQKPERHTKAKISLSGAIYGSRYSRKNQVKIVEDNL